MGEKPGLLCPLPRKPWRPRWSTRPKGRRLEDSHGLGDYYEDSGYYNTNAYITVGYELIAMLLWWWYTSHSILCVTFPIVDWCVLCSRLPWGWGVRRSGSAKSSATFPRWDATDQGRLSDLQGLTDVSILWDSQPLLGCDKTYLEDLLTQFSG